MIRSRRLALAAAVVILGLTACGDPSTTAPLADQPQVIQLATGQSGAGSAAPAAAESLDAAGDSKMAYWGATDFVYDGELPALDSPAASWFFPTGQEPDLERIGKLAAALGVEGEVRVLPEDQGGGWAVGPEDYSAAVLTVGSDGMLNWWLSGAPTTTPAFACGESVVAVDPAAGTVDAVASTSAPAEDATAPPTVAVAPDAVAPECATPTPPVGVPTKDEALATAKQLFADWGYDVDSYQFDDAYADEWGASINASLLLDGMKAPVLLSVGFGENGVVTYASGALADPQRGADYPTIGAPAGLDRLKTQQNEYMYLDSMSARSAAGDAVSTDIAVGAPDIAPCEPGPAVDCGPVDVEPIVVTLNSVKSDLTMLWAADNTIWLLPAYSFGSADGGIYTVIAVEDAYIQQPDLEAVPTGQTEPAVDPGVDPADVPTQETVLPVQPDGSTACPAFPPTTDSPAPVEQIAETVVGYCLAEAEDIAAKWGYSVRVVRQDGIDLDATDDFSDTRINVATRGDIVAEVVSIG